VRGHAQSGNPLGPRVGRRNKTTIAAAMKAVTSALAGAVIYAGRGGDDSGGIDDA
jgi:hypothetical protein